MRPFQHMRNVLLGAAATGLMVGSVVPATAAATTTTSTVATTSPKAGPLATAKAAVQAFSSQVRGLSHPRALESAFNAYYLYKAANPGAVKKPYLYFVDYGQPSTAKRGYVFDMNSMKIVEGPFTVAHGSGSGGAKATRFANGSGSHATSLGLYSTANTYGFSGKSAGSRYSSIGLRLKGLSKGFNDKALARGVVAHGAPYVTANRAGRSQGCPAMEQARAQRLLPMISNGAMVFLFAPDANWMAGDPWVNAA